LKHRIRKWIVWEKRTVVCSVKKDPINRTKGYKNGYPPDEGCLVIENPI
jgi:hypothetical protein